MSLAPTIVGAIYLILCKNTTVPLKWTNRYLKKLIYSLLRAILRVNGFVFVSLLLNSIGYNESRSIRFLSSGQSFGQKPLQLSCSQVWWKQVREVLFMLEPIAFNDGLDNSQIVKV